ncbi:1,4-dihydroxy-2-naphthoate polyprenyltransferase [Tersicoccus phoenicis]|uniref:1,4-dihydroxy-2-naphthoate octaprenyltransferase n=1 Tax=Tersicoccus phoenicis TaxID=554083 RepID=A0A1R1LHJ4_9MICC|nr:1,4-dihydroxy-2-naphthoate polyprenyltransferase [Tersicoccus phoenicis]OMH26986.1 1,4-dihydroxy-2-naphthoate polyprenyltransferase [Tersicoccus phoenicis]
MASTAQWVEGARLRTLPMAMAPVIAGSAAAAGLGAFHPLRALLALVVALLLQIGVNYANDYSDGIRGTDDARVGPLRLVGSGAASPAAVKRAALGCFAVAMVAGLLLVVLSGTWWLLALGAASVAAAWYYTGGSRPYGYRGLGDVFVFVFFGLVATLGTTYTQALTVSAEAVVAAVATGLIATALLMANNIRDIPTDRAVGKHTLAVRLGDRAARGSYVGMLAVALLLVLVVTPANPWLLLVLLLAPVCVPACRRVLTAKDRAQLIPVLRQTGLINLGYSILFTIGILLDLPS